MTGRKHDIAIVGGGLAGGLIALALRRARPDLSVALIERGEALGGNHRWSWFTSDLDAAGNALLAAFPTRDWQAAYAVRFPGLERRLGTGYRSLASADFDAALRGALPAEALLLGTAVGSMDAQGVTLADGRRIAARTVIDCRGIAAPSGLRGGWQVFMGRHLRTPGPHGLDHPIIMDATVDQPGAYRFVYTLPLAADELFVEDTYYADSPALDTSVLSGRIDAYCASQGWQGEELGRETGVLPVITGGDFSAFQAAHRTPGVAVAGARGGFVHPLTSYSLPHAVAIALAIASRADLPGPALADWLDAQGRAHWQATRFYRQLGAMLFGAARPDQRYRVFSHFYRLPEGLIERFYAARSTGLDRARILCGRPPVPVTSALRALLVPGAPIAERRAA